MPLIPQQQLIHIDRMSSEGGFFGPKVEKWCIDAIQAELENYPPVKIVQFQITDQGVFVLVETV